MEQNSKHTQGKIQTGYRAILSDDPKVEICSMNVCSNINADEADANAERIVECWNGYDNLKIEKIANEVSLRMVSEKRDALEVLLSKERELNTELKESISILQGSNDLIKKELDIERELSSELIETLQSVLHSWDKSLRGHKEKFLEFDDPKLGMKGSYWTPAAALIDSEVINKVRLALAKATQQ